MTDQLQPTNVVSGTMSINAILKATTAKYIDDIKDNPPEPDQIERELLGLMKQNIEALNFTLPKGQAFQIPKQLNHSQIGDLIIALHPVAKVVISENEDDESANLLAVYQQSGKYEGTYRFDKRAIDTLARRYKYSITKNEIAEVKQYLEEQAPRKRRTTNPDLIAVNNGIFNYRTKTLEPFSPDKVYLSKCTVNYNPIATSPNIHNEDDNTYWDVDSWVASLSDDPEIVQVIWEILSAIVRPHVAWDKSAWLFSTLGSNGKGTLVVLMRNLVGKGSYASIPIANFGKPYALEPLLNATSIIVDENDVGTYIDKAAKLKAVVTNDVIDIDRKFKDDVAFQFHGFMVQCLNEFPRISDRTNSFNRRQLFIPMNKSFEGVERKYIKSDYLHRQDVLEYVLKKVLHTDFYKLSNPKASQQVLDEFKTANDPLFDFANQVMPNLSWNTVPTDFLYDLYKVWYANNVSNRKEPGSKITFRRGLESIIQNHHRDWTFENTQVRLKLDTPELLIVEYGLESWYGKTSSNDPTKVANPNRPSRRYTGVFKKKQKD